LDKIRSGMTLAEDIRATEDFPQFFASTMDGFAIHLDDDDSLVKGLYMIKAR
jgi:molybdopterin biosynthesis enzyme